MRTGEIHDIREQYPIMTEVLREIERGHHIDAESPFYQGYLLARQRGYVERAGTDRNTIVLSERGKLFLETGK